MATAPITTIANFINDDTITTKDNISQSGIDSLRFLSSKKTTENILTKIGAVEVEPSKDTIKTNPSLKAIIRETEDDTTSRYNKERYPLTIKRYKIAKGKSTSNYITIVSNSKCLKDFAKAQNRATNAFCYIYFNGLHQPTKAVK